MRLKEIRTHKLFGIFDHAIPLNMDDRITIIHGPNGYGKTAVLRLIAGVFTPQYGVLRELPFDRLELCMYNGSVLTVTADGFKDDANRDHIVFDFPPNEPFDLSRQHKSSIRTINKGDLETFIPGLERVGVNEWFSLQTGETMDFEGVLDRFTDELPFRTRKKLEYPIWLTELQESLDVHFIRANRLELNRAHRTSKSRQSEWISVVARFADELAGLIRSTLATYAELSQSLDRSFPHRLVVASNGSSHSPEAIRGKLNQLEQQRKNLVDAGLLDHDQQPDVQIPAAEIEETKWDVLSVYVSDVEKKLAVFSDLYAKIDLFRSILNRKFQYKSVAVNKHEGIVFRTEDGKQLPPSSLSSGEQHEVVLLYQLLFKVKRDSLILIDEPELSLHVAWQKQFLRDLSQITALANFDALIATHSPQIISDRWDDLTVELRGPKECESTSMSMT